MKSLYSILGVTPDATPAQIEEAYAGSIERLTAADATLPADERQIRLVAVREAWRTLSNPDSRRAYDQRRLTQSLPLQVSEVVVAEPFWDLKKLILLAAIVVGCFLYYLHNAKERESMRIAHEKEVVLKALKLKEEEQQARAAAEEERQERIKQQTADARERQQRYEEERFRREADARVRQIEYAEQRKVEQEARQAEQERRRREAELQNEQRRRVMELQRLERSNARGY